MKRIVLACLACFSVSIAVSSCASSPAAMRSTTPEAPAGRPAADLVGAWAGAIQLGVQSLQIAVHFGGAAGAYTGTIDIPQQGAHGLNLSSIDFKTPRLVFDLPAGPGVAHFDGSLEQDRISGSFTQGTARGTFELRRVAAADAASVAPAPASVTPAEGAPVSLTTATGTLEGTLDVPSGSGPLPVALIISGSGPTDRNGNSALLNGRNDSLEMVARALREAGIASLRYDKRGVGGSAAALGGEAGLTFDVPIEDAVGWIRLLKSDPRFSRVAVIGHSEGSLIGMEAARIAGADAFVSLEGAGRPAAEILKDQLAPQPPALRDTAYSIIDSLVAGKTVAVVPQEWMSLFRPDIQPYLISWFRYDPRASIASLKVPVLIVQGTTDLQTAVKDGEALHGAVPSAQYALIEGMNHVLKLAPADPQRNLAAYSDPSLPLPDALVSTLTAFLNRALR
jgi:pimeloyl-ACP methyl ester carboxylesterase